MAKDQKLELRVACHPGKRQMEVITLAGGSPIASIAFDQEQAEQHARAVIDAIEILQRQKSLLVLPERVSPQSSH